jgi:peroxiredoxin
MRELVQLEERYKDFEDRNAQVVVVSLDGRDEAREMKEKKGFHHLRVVADRDGNLIRNARILHEGAHSPLGGEMAAPTTVLIDRHGQVRWLHRADRYLERLSPRQLLDAMAEHMPIPGDGKG